MTLGVRVIACNGEGEILLVRHGYVDGWHLPGGGVERGQTMEQAALRELEEETGYRPLSGLQICGVCFNRHASPRDHVAVFRCDGVEQVSVFKPNREIAETGFFPPDNLPDGTTSGTRSRIAEWQAGVQCAPVW